MAKNGRLGGYPPAIAAGRAKRGVVPKAGGEPAHPCGVFERNLLPSLSAFRSTSAAEHDGRDWIPSVLTLPLNGEIDEGYVAPLIQDRNVQNIRTIRCILR